MRALNLGMAEDYTHRYAPCLAQLGSLSSFCQPPLWLCHYVPPHVCSLAFVPRLYASRAPEFILHLQVLVSCVHL